MRFSQVVGQEKIKQHLLDSSRSNRTAHAQLFLGSEGCGALALALAYAQYLQCERPEANDACGACPACIKAQKYVHPDIHFSFPSIGTGKISSDFMKQWRTALAEDPYMSLQSWLQRIGAENQQGNINKNECEDIMRRLSLKAAEGRYKILLLWMPELLGKEGNRLLKLIEEPEPQTVFLLVAEQSEKIINTILSRCQHIHIPRLSDDEVIAYLQKNTPLTATQRRYIAYMSAGNLAKARQLAEESSDQPDYARLWREFLALAHTGTGAEWTKWVDDTASSKSANKLGRKEQILFLQYGLHFLRELVGYKVHNNADILRLSAEELPLLQQLARLKFGVFQQIQQRVDDAVFYIERNGAARMVLLALLIEMQRALQSR